MSKYLKKRVLASIVAVCAFCTMGINGTLVSAAEANTNEESSTVTSTTTDAAATVEEPNASGYIFGHVNVTGGGYMPSIIYNKSEKDLIYARADMGGAYRWDPQNKKWIQLIDMFGHEDWNWTGVESIATDPVDTNRVYMACGTYVNQSAKTNGCILRSTDRGKTFEKTDLPFKNGSNVNGRQFGERLNVDPNDNSVIYFGTRCGNGLWKSTDYGVTWNKVESFTAVGDYSEPTDASWDPGWATNTLGVLWEEFDPSSSEKGKPCQTIYVGVANKLNEEVIYCTKDGGKTWNPVEGQPRADWKAEANYPADMIPGRATLASNGMLYVSYDNQGTVYGGTRGRVYKYNTKTGEWTDITPVKEPTAIWGYGGMTVDASNPDIIMTSELNHWWPDANIYRSIDGGKTWLTIWKMDYSDNITRQNNYSLDYSASPWIDWGIIAEYPKSQPKVGWMIGCVAIDPFDSNHVSWTDGATVYGVHDMTNLEQGKRVKIQVEAQGIEETAAQDLITPPVDGVKLISSTADVGGFLHTDITKSPQMMTNPTISNVASMDYAELNPNVIVRCGDIGKVAISKDGGKSWAKTRGALSIGDTGGDYMTVGGNICVSADGKTVLYSPKGHGVVYSNNDGDSWNDSVGVPASAKVISDRVNSKKFYAFSNGEFYVSVDGGATFEKTVDTLTGTKDMSAIPGAEGDIWVAADTNGMWHSTDSGKTFEKLSNVENAAIVGFGKAAPGKTYMSIYTHSKINGIWAIFRSDDEGETWIRCNDDKHQYGAANSAITGDQTEFGKFYLATNGMGIVYGELDKK